MCFSLPEKGSPYIVRKKHSEAENSEAENSEHLSEINESTSTLYTVCNPYIQYQNYQGYIQPQYHQHASFPGYIQPQYHQPASFPGYIYPHIQPQHQGWHKSPPLYQTLPSDHRTSKTWEEFFRDTIATDEQAAHFHPDAQKRHAEVAKILRSTVERQNSIFGSEDPPAAPSPPSVGEPDLNPNSRAETRRNHNKRLYCSWQEPSPGGLGMYHVPLANI